MLARPELKPIGPWMKGMIVGYVEKQVERHRYLLSKRHWFVMHVSTQREFKIRNEIIELGYGAYCPHAMRKVRLIGERYRECRKPLFMGYMFASFDPDGEPWQSQIRHMEGVLRVFSIEDRPVPIPDYQMDLIQEAEQREREGKRRQLATIDAKPGDLVRIKDGPFASFFGIVLEVDQKHSRIKVEVNLFGRKTPAEFEADQIEVALDSPTGLNPSSRPQYRLPRSPR